MPDYVSPDTGRRLREAGLVWYPAVGDWALFEWYGCNGVPEIGFVDDLLNRGIVHLRGWFSTWQGERRADGITVPWVDAPWPPCTWLPTTGQLLEILKSGGLCPQMAWLDKWVVLFRTSKAGWLTVACDRPAEALAEAWLRVQAQEVQP